MKVERITVTAGRTRKDPVHDFSSLRAEITVEAAIAPGEDWEVQLYDLQQRAERLIDDHINVVESQIQTAGAAARAERQKTPPQIRESQSASPNLPQDAVARDIASLVTPKQLVAIRAIANARGLNAENQCLDFLKCRPEELSRRAASSFIDYLQKATARAEQPPLPATAGPEDDCPF